MHIPRVAPLSGLLLTFGSLVAQCTTQWLPGDGIPGVGGTVYASTMWDPDGTGPAAPQLVVGGTFQTAGTVLASRVAAWNPATGTWAALGNGTNGDVRALATLPNGDLIAAGSFTNAGGVTVSNIAIWNGAAWSPLGPGLSGPVNALAVLQNGDLIAGGQFAAAGATTTLSIARWDGATWSGLGSGLAPAVWTYGVYALTVMQNGDLIAGGRFTIAGSVATSLVARWDGTSWSALGAGLSRSTGLDGVFALTTLPNGTLVAGGSFTTFGYGMFLASWNGVAWSSFGINVGGAFNNVNVSSMATLPNGDLVVGGLFSYANGGSARHIARWNGTAWAALGTGMSSQLPNAAAPVYALTVLPSGDLVAGGAFTVAGGTGASCVASWNGTAWSRLSSGTDGGVAALVRFGNGDLVAGGSFLGIGGVNAQRVARWNGVAWSPLGTGMDGPVGALAVLPNGDLIAGGSFTTAGGVNANSMARWDGVAWSPLGAGLGFVAAVGEILVLPNGDLIVGGSFTVAGGVPANNIARWNGTSWSALGAGTSGSVQTLARLPNGDIVAGGSFTAAGGIAVNYITSWDGTAWSALGSGIAGSVGALAVLANGDLVAAGWFNTAGGISANNIASWNGTAWQPLGAGLTGGANFFGSTALVILPNGDLAAAGNYASWATGVSNDIRRWNGTSWSTFATGINGAVWTLLLQPTGELVVGGSFTIAGGNVTGALARLRTTCPALVASYGAGCSGSGGANVLSAVTLPWLGSTFQALATGLPANSLAVGVLGLNQTLVPLPSLWSWGVPGCSLLASPDRLDLLLPSTGSASGQWVIPDVMSLAGRSLNYQVVPLELDPSGSITAATATNALALTIGAF